MTKKFLWPLMGCLIFSASRGQHSSPTKFRNFPVIISLQFNSLAMPFKDMKSSFSNVGIGLGTAVTHSGKNNWVQEFTAVWYRNRTIGNGLHLYTQTAWHPTLSGDVHGTVSLGVGYLVSFRPVSSFRQQDGQWVDAKHKGKGMLTVPMGVGLGYYRYSEDTYASPFVSYQFVPAFGYNKSVSVIPETFLQAGTAIHPKP
jgi:hypothetical protein